MGTGTKTVGRQAGILSKIDENLNYSSELSEL